MHRHLTAPDARAIAARIWRAFPVTEPSFAKLLGLLEIEVSREQPTAAVSLGTRSRLIINPDFVARHCTSDEALVMLVLHELWHVALGHTRLYKCLTPAQNWAFDAIINARLCRLYPGTEHTRLFRELYAPDDLPWALLRPPEGWRTASEKWLEGRPGKIHRALYEDSSASMEELFGLLPRKVRGELADGLLLGSHGGDTFGNESPDGEGAGSGEGTGDTKEANGPVSPEVLAEIRRIVAEWPMVEIRSGRDQGGELARRHVDPEAHRHAATNILRHAMLRLTSHATGGGRLVHDTAPVGSILPYGRDRRESVRALRGDGVSLHRSELAGRAPARRDRVHVYLDVSGSMNAVLGPLYAALASLASWLAPQVWLFSTSVRDVSVANLRSGVVLSTGGTNIRCVTAHLLEHKARHALIVTDGWVGSPPSEHVRGLRERRVRIETVLTHGGDARFMDSLGGRVSCLPVLR